MREDHQAFKDVYSDYVGLIRAYLARRVPYQDVEDLAADVFAVAWRKRSSVTAGEELPWLYRIASFIVANYRRREKHRADFLWLFHEPDSAPAADAFVDQDPELAAAWATLSTSQRELLALVVVEGVAVKDVATILDITPNAVSIRVHRAKKQLSDALAGERLSEEKT
jgi:RNA polymerase sigma-70 factor (ECF subfamily)